MATRPKRDFSYAFVHGLFKGRDWNALHKVISEGVRRRAFGAPTVTLFISYAVTDEDIRRDLRSAIVSDRSWKRRVADKSPLSPAEVERMTDVGEVIREVRRLYGGDEAAADKFLTTPHRRFGGRPPILVAATEGGAQAVRELLARMEEGAPA
ncbi:MAG TPA: MbcA/ParS/Xre antitoxin family protein [Gemmatimonadaceae bacterium]